MRPLENPHCLLYGAPANHPYQLSKEDEEAAGDEIEVRREDQDKINRFSRLHQRELGIEDELKNKNKEKEELDDLDTELDLVEDEEELVQ